MKLKDRFQPYLEIFSDSRIKELKFLKLKKYVLYDCEGSRYSVFSTDSRDELMMTMTLRGLYMPKMNYGLSRGMAIVRLENVK